MKAAAEARAAPAGLWSPLGISWCGVAGVIPVGARESGGFPADPCCLCALSPPLGSGAAEVCSSRDVALRGSAQFPFVEASSERFCEINKMF